VALFRREPLKRGHANAGGVGKKNAGEYLASLHTVLSTVRVAVGTCMLKLTTDKHEASRGLSVTAELLVIYDLCVIFLWLQLHRREKTVQSNVLCVCVTCVHLDWQNTLH